MTLQKRKILVVESATAEQIAFLAWASGTRPVAWGPLFRRAALFRSSNVVRCGGQGWSMGLICERGRTLGAAEEDTCVYSAPDFGTAVLVHGGTPNFVKALAGPF